MTRLRPLFIALALALALLANSPAAPSDSATDQRLRVVSFNVWGLPFGSTQREQRIAAIPAAIDKLKAQIIGLQEVWRDDDAASLIAAFEKLGYPYSHHTAGGLLTISRFPLSSKSFIPFTIKGLPYKIWHADWFGGKGLSATTVMVKGFGPVRFFNTHLHARYGNDQYLSVQISHALTIALNSNSTQPAIMLGDFNSVAGSIPFELLSRANHQRAAFLPAAPKMGIDAVLFQPTARHAIRCETFDYVLEDARELGGEAPSRLSDHPAAVATLVISPAKTPPSTKAQHKWRLAEDIAKLPIAAALTATNAAQKEHERLALFFGVLFFGSLAGAFLTMAKRKSSQTKSRAQLWKLVGITLIVVALGSAAIAPWHSSTATDYRQLQDSLRRLAGPRR